jgi:hypothetical protein
LEIISGTLQANDVAQLPVEELDHLIELTLEKMVIAMLTSRPAVAMPDLPLNGSIAPR